MTGKLTVQLILAQLSHARWLLLSSSHMCLDTCVSLATVSHSPYVKQMMICRFVLENSGVAEPQNLRDKFNEAIFEGHPVMTRIRLDNMITIVDSGTFIKDYSSRTALAARPDLGEGGTLRPVVDLLVEQIE